jgi:glyoxylase-like metal-dependent hydrolase (beta-lactamase superfamily II)
VEGKKPLHTAGGLFGSIFAALRLYYRYKPVKVDVMLNDGDTIDVLGGFKAITLSGHSEGNLGLYGQPRRLMFSSDTIRVMGDKLVLPHPMFTEDPKSAIGAIKRLSELDFNIMLPGHGKPIMSNASEKVKELYGELKH